MSGSLVEAHELCLSRDVPVAETLGSDFFLVVRVMVRPGESAHIKEGTGRSLMTPQPRLAVKQLGLLVRRERKRNFARCETVTTGIVVADASLPERLKHFLLRLALGWLC